MNRYKAGTEKVILRWLSKWDYNSSLQDFIGKLCYHNLTQKQLTSLQSPKSCFSPYFPHAFIGSRVKTTDTVEELEEYIFLGKY
jgi:hypothetical protein